MERMLNPHGIIFEQQHMGARRSCSICERKLVNKAYFLTESEDAPRPQQSWLLCAPCNLAVQAGLASSELRPAIRTRVVVGLVASQRGPANRPRWWQERYWEELDDQGWNRVIFWSIIAIAFGHVLVFVILMMWPFIVGH
jgi:hypothetical protein